MVAKSKNKALSCSTPEHRIESPSRDSDSICDSESASPVPFLCTQDGAEGETDVVWNFYTPKSETAKSRLKNTTPLSRRPKKTVRSIPNEKPIPRRRPVKPSQKKTELFQDLLELNQNLHEYISKKPSVTTVVSKPQSEEDIFSDTSDSSPRSGLKSKNRCLRKNVLSSKFTKAEPESGLESDDSMNECLLKASQVVEENILNLQPKPAKRPCFDSITKCFKPGLSVNIDQDSMDTILNNIKLESPSVNRIKKCDSPKLNNDSFDCLLGNLNDSALERLSQMPIKSESRNRTSKINESSWMLKELVVCDGSPSSKTVFGRHNSMPESPSVNNSNKPSTSGTAFGRYSSMPFNKSDDKITVPGDSPIRCTPDEIKKKHKQAREKLMAKRQLPFTATQQSIPTLLQSQINPVPKKTSFQLKVPSSKVNSVERKDAVQKTNTDVDIKLIIEKKRQEALMKLRKRQPLSK
ncbi:jg8107 [Pararge aegeria aegeria]|uniref:Jg8107 protein n=2 Tax=Pararge aegeria TaxID=116150 RepID=A0A8S4SBA8_9NEOP|nr:jg8107 [Pararge aegeria aegeria]